MTAFTAASLPLADGSVAVPRRVRSLDALRGLAVVFMVVDHVALVAGLPLLRIMPGRLAMPLFFVLGGHLTTGLRRRHFLILTLGVVLQVLAPWAGPGLVLTSFVIGAWVVALAWSMHPGVLWLPIMVALTFAANGATETALTFDLRSMVALMCAGALLPRSVFLTAGGRLPRWLSVLGRYPLSLYAGHLVLLGFFV